MSFRIKVEFQKYLAVMRASWINGFAYPVSFWLWRVRQMLQVVIALSLWESVFSRNLTAFGYTKEQMLTYIFVANAMNYLILSSRSIDVVNVIHSGDLSLYLVKPLNFFMNWFTRDIADKLQNLAFAAMELTILFSIFRPGFYIPKSLETYLFMFLAMICGIFLYFFINMIFGFVGFWSPDSWAPRFLFFMIMYFVAGSLFPLDIFPRSVVSFFSYTPFPYLMYFQTKIWLEQFSNAQLIFGTSLMTLWTIFFLGLTKFLWNKGVRGYGAEGR